jgi:hypothetical protein
MAGDILGSVDKIKNVIAALDIAGSTVKELTAADGAWSRDLSKSFAGTEAIDGIGPLKATGKASAAMHLARAPGAPVDGYKGDKAHPDPVFVSLDLALAATAGLTTTVPFGAVAGAVNVGIKAGADAHWAQHRRVPSDDTLLDAARALLASLCDPFDAAAAARLGPDDTLQLDVSGDVLLTATAGWEGMVSKELCGKTLQDLGVSEPIEASLGLKAGLTVTAKLGGSLRIIVGTSANRPGWARLRLCKTSSELVGLGLSLEATASPGDCGKVVGAALERAIPGSLAEEAGQQLAQDVTAKVQQHVAKGLTAELGAAINRAVAGEALVDLDVRLADRADAYAAAMRGDFSALLLAARAPGDNGVEVNACSLKEIVKLERSFKLHLNLFGFDLTHYETSSTTQTVEVRADGTVWLSGSAGATLLQQSPDELENVSFLFDAGLAATGGESLTASLVWRQQHNVAKEIAAAVDQHVAALTALQLGDLALAGSIAAAIRATKGDYAWTLRLTFSSGAVRRLLFLDRPDLDDKAYRRLVWTYMRAASRAIGATTPSADPNKPCPLDQLLTAERIEQISEFPESALPPPGSSNYPTSQALTMPGYRFDRPQLFAFWLLLGNVHAFVASLVAARSALRQGLDAQRLSGQLARLAALAASLRTTKGWAYGTTVAAKYIALPLITGFEPGSARMQFTRGSVDVSV